MQTKRGMPHPQLTVLEYSLRTATEYNQVAYSFFSIGRYSFSLESLVDMDKVPEEKTRNVFCFFFFGVLSIFFHEVMQAATKDVLAGSHITALTAVLTTGVPQVGFQAIN